MARPSAEPPRAFTNGRILTMVPGPSSVRVVVVQNERIVGVGPQDLLDHFPGAAVEDLGGRTLCPGFIDAHHHLSIAAHHPRWAQVADAHTPDDLASALVAYAETEPETPWIRAAGWSDVGTGFVPHRRDLDALGLGRPVIVAHYSLHQAVVDRRGLDALGIGSSTPDPPGGSIGRDADGTLNGLLTERAWSDAHTRSMPPFDTPECWAELIETAARRLLANGITAIHDAACSPGAEAAYRLLADQGRLPISVLVCPHPAALFSPPDLSRLEGPPTGEGDDRLRVGPAKLFADGGVAPAINVHLDGQHVAFGTLFGGLTEQVEAVVARGFRAAVHAIGNAGLDATLAAFDAAAHRHRGVDHRFRVEHACLASPPQLRHLAGLGGVAVVQPGFVDHFGRQLNGLVFDDATWLPFADIARSGAVVAASSDSPCTFHEPLRTSTFGAHRRTSTGLVLDADQSVPYEDWLRAYTAGAAYAGGQEKERGTLTPGVRADLVVLDGPLDAEHPPTVTQTWVAGRLVYDRRPAGGGTDQAPPDGGRTTHT